MRWLGVLDLFGKHGRAGAYNENAYCSLELYSSATDLARSRRAAN